MTQPYVRVPLDKLRLDSLSHGFLDRPERYALVLSFKLLCQSLSTLLSQRSQVNKRPLNEPGAGLHVCQIDNLP